jgi:hypothetical protein
MVEDDDNSGDDDDGIITKLPVRLADHLINGAHRNWERYARALDMRINDGATLPQIAASFGVSAERARQMVIVGQRQLAFRVFKGAPRPLPPPAHLRAERFKFPLSFRALKG